MKNELLDSSKLFHQLEVIKSENRRLEKALKEKSLSISELFDQLDRLEVVKAENRRLKELLGECFHPFGEEEEDEER